MSLLSCGDARSASELLPRRLSLFAAKRNSARSVRSNGETGSGSIIPTLRRCMPTPRAAQQRPGGGGRLPDALY